MKTWTLPQAKKQLASWRRSRDTAGEPNALAKLLGDDNGMPSEFARVIATIGNDRSAFAALKVLDGDDQSTINLRVYFWLNGHEHSWLKVRSSVIRLVKFAVQQQGISMPGEAREVVFPQGVPVTMLEEKPGDAQDVGLVKRFPVDSREKRDAASTKAGGGLSSEADVIGEQARQVRPLNNGK